MYDDIEQMLRERGLKEITRKAIREAKICIVDDRIDDLKTFIDGLKKEGFTHLVQKKAVQSVNELVDGKYDLLVMDLSGIAPASVDSDDGFGILSKFKKAQPAVPVLVVSGTAASVDKLMRLNDADLIRSKPVSTAALAEDIEELLAPRRDEHWAALGILRELVRIEPELKQKLGFLELQKLQWQQYRIRRKLRKLKPGLSSHLLTVANIVTRTGALAIRIIGISKGFVGHA